MTQSSTAEYKQTAPSEHDLTVRDALPVIDDIIERYQSTKGALIPVLQSTQNLLGYLPKEVLIHISDKLDIPYSEIAGVVTFYSYFTTVPRGKHTVRVCLGTACYVRGGKEVLDAMSKELGIEVGQTTEDRQFTLEIGRCFGACGLAPVVMIDDAVHQRVKPSRIKQLIDLYRVDMAEGDEDGNR